MLLCYTHNKYITQRAYNHDSGTITNESYNHTQKLNYITLIISIKSQNPRYALYPKDYYKATNQAHIPSRHNVFNGRCFIHSLHNPSNNLI